LEEVVYAQFQIQREGGNIVRHGWFRNAWKVTFKDIYPELGSDMFIFSQGWFTRFLSWHNI
ncbi:hypothetical protein L873DRAFT_1914411, partial [Choiromyces venosus 120613-1]